MKYLIIYVVGIWVCWQHSDIYSNSTLLSIVAPLGLVFFTVALVVWIILKFRIRGQTDGSGLTSIDFGSDGE